LPKHETYNSLKSALKRYNSIANAGGWNKVDVGETIKFGAQGPRVLQVKNRLAASGDYQGELNNEVYDSTLFKAVTSFQTRYGLTADGEIGKGTVEAMNVSVVERVNQIKVNMERWRWLPKEFGDFYLMVNIADFKLEVVKAGKVERTHKVIVGKNFRRTPVFSSKMTYLVLCPTWTVPPGILRNDVLPAARKDIAIFEKKKLQIFDQSGNIVDPATVDWNDKVVNSFIYRQPAGADNALGDVKFMFPNNFSVYIHDTPTRDLFDKTERNFSSGCIRLHEPLKMAEYLLQGTDWTFEKIKKHVATATPLTIHLKEQPNVHILYWTAWTRDGIVQFRKDIYGRDPKLLESLMESNPTPVTD
jgi:murein L,D-transpeptidase YcbB/YkuD